MKERFVFVRGVMEQPVYTTLRTHPGSVDSEPAMSNEARALSGAASSTTTHNGRVLDAAVAARSSSGAAAGLLYVVAKRLLDVVASFLGLLLLFPFLVVLALMVRRDSPGPIFHRRRVLEKQAYREGVAPRTFDAFKFRTMISDADEYLRRHPHLLREFQRDYKLRNDPRITPLGHKLRTTSLDELPQLLNVLRGQMTLVGPRIISPPELAHYGEHADRLLSVKPGLTGLWQVSGRQCVSYAERVRLDMWYIENRSFWLDINILFRTVVCVLLRQGAY
jgi:lipopolysaccharide/colanic/teichoic acid biosynthesis glycosyltransferase